MLILAIQQAYLTDSIQLIKT